MGQGWKAGRKWGGKSMEGEGERAGAGFPRRWEWGEKGTNLQHCTIFCLTI